MSPLTLSCCITRATIPPPCRLSLSANYNYKLSRALSSSVLVISNPPLSTPLPISSSTLLSTRLTLPTTTHFIPHTIPNLQKTLQTATMSTSPLPLPLPTRYKLIFFVPTSHLEACKDAVFACGAGTFPGGKYTKCCFQTPGQGQFLPSEGANPAIGVVGTVETVQEIRVEVMCLGREVMGMAVQALVEAHPYEEVAYEVYKMEDV
ncbi:hypothetical protein BO70DRAFT_366010 [Aspergillus heteromorphus CBS 117.55]|uniref:ATP phosphoribosyltransferase n=1 Tax=Aspergillus heteromorphus CBS 117.55 TaxID=1448321 RepID=A0A317V6G6_9EURO|nr:uncharacterized protein BO70DRAFT_366010 [Aspergillus heteromorphus CBS 117.55]PWY68638.1 hypothetical protein BO70DRAFT_366010 [Aspergillus heteromorphus CBS 117.55]